MSVEEDKKAARARFSRLTAISETADNKKEEEKNNEKKEDKKGLSHMLMSSLFTSINDFVSFALMASLAFAMGALHLGYGLVLAAALLYAFIRNRQRDRETQRAWFERLSVEGEASALSGLSLPTWATFPEVERVEWLNTLVGSLWPNLNLAIQSLLKQKIEPNIRQVLRNYNLMGFAFTQVDLGTLAPRIEGFTVTPIKAVNNASCEIVLDADLHYCGDAQLGISLMGLGARIENLQLRARFRLILKPLLHTLPIVGGIQLTMPRAPEQLDFDLRGAASLLDLPCVAQALRLAIRDQLSLFLVSPNKFGVLLSDHISPEQLLMPCPRGVFVLSLLEAENLVQADTVSRNDVYAVVRHGALREYKSAVAKGSEPKWEDKAMFFASEHPDTDELVISLFDEDKATSDDPMGAATLAMAVVARNNALIEQWIPLEAIEQGSVKLKMGWFNVAQSREASAYENLKENKNLPSALMTLFIDKCKVMKSTDKDLALVLRLVDSQMSLLDEQNTRNVSGKETSFQEGFVFTLVGRIDQLSLQMRLVQRTLTNNEDLLAQAKIHLGELIHKDYLKSHERELRDEQDLLIAHLSVAIKVLYLVEPETKHFNNHFEAAHFVGESARKVAKGVVGASVKSLGNVTHGIGNRMGYGFRALRQRKNVDEDVNNNKEDK